MSDPGTEIIKLAKDINAGKSGNHRSKAEWYRVTKALAEEQRRSDESSERAFARFVTETDDGRALFAAYKCAEGPDYQTFPKPIVVKTGTAYDALKKLADDLRAEEPDLSESQAFSKVFTNPAHRDLAEASKREGVT